MSEDSFKVILQSALDKSTELITSADKFESAVSCAVAAYDPSNKAYSAYLNGSGNASTLTQDLISTLGEGAQNNLDNIRTINKIIRKYVNINDLIGMVVQSISNNVNAEYKLSYKNVGEQKKKIKTLETAKILIEDFNNQINVRQFIRDAIVITYIEGNYFVGIRNNNNYWSLDYYPLTIVENSGYNINGNPAMLVNINDLKSALTKTMVKNKSGKPLFFLNVDEEIKNNYPKEVYDAYTAKEKYAALNTKYTGMVRINNFRGKYGLSPIFRALSPTLILEDYRMSDETNAKAKAKKIIHQKMRKECMGQSFEKKAYDDMAYAHEQLMQAWKNKTVLITSTPCVESILYVEPKVSDTPVENINIYRNKVLSSLGVAFLAADKSQTANTAKINLSQLMRCINTISEQVETVLRHFYIALLEDNNIDMEYCPTIKVIDSEMLEMNVRMELAKLLYATFGASRETTFNMLGVDLEDERCKRELENMSGLEEIFVPRATSYTTSNNNMNSGRPSDEDSNNPDKQEIDKISREK